MIGSASPNQRAVRSDSKSSVLPRPASLVVSSSGSAPASRRPSSSAYRYSLNVGGVKRFPSPSSASDANQIRAPETHAKRQSTDDQTLMIEPNRASASSSTSSSHVSSSRYAAEEADPQRRAVVHNLPSDPTARGPWSKSNANKNDAPAPTQATKTMTTFPFPHPVTPRTRRTDPRTNLIQSSAGGDGSSTRRTDLIGQWQRLLNTIFAGPYERQLLREEQRDDEITDSIIQGIANRSGSAAPRIPSNYGAIPDTSTKQQVASSTSSDDQDATINDPYGYRRLAGPHLLPSYSTDLATRRRERRRARSRARFHCMALWTISTVSILLLIIVAVCLFSFEFPDRLPLPGGSPEESSDPETNVFSSLAPSYLVSLLSLFLPLHTLTPPSS